MALQSWVLRSGGRTVLVDTGVGDGRERPAAPLFHRRRDDLLGGLERAGVRPEDVDVVVNTHLHADHVGWNTRPGDAPGEWVPAFPNARYLLPAADDAHFGPGNAYGGGLRAQDRLVYEDSVAPVHREGLAVLWDGRHRIDGNLTLESLPGHTPGRRCCAWSPGRPGGLRRGPRPQPRTAPGALAQQLLLHGPGGGGGRPPPDPGTGRGPAGTGRTRALRRGGGGRSAQGGRGFALKNWAEWTEGETRVPTVRVLMVQVLTGGPWGRPRPSRRRGRARERTRDRARAREREQSGRRRPRSPRPPRGPCAAWWRIRRRRGRRSRPWPPTARRARARRRSRRRGSGRRNRRRPRTCP